MAGVEVALFVLLLVVSILTVIAVVMSWRLPNAIRKAFDKTLDKIDDARMPGRAVAARRPNSQP